jgi:hypothetical protein
MNGTLGFAGGFDGTITAVSMIGDGVVDGIAGGQVKQFTVDCRVGRDQMLLTNSWC